MAIDPGKKEQEGPKTSVKWACPSCGKTAHISRRRCDCGASLRGAGVVVSAKPPACGPLNFEAPGLSCNDCPGGCLYCASFGISETNSAGFGGEECEHRVETARCHCCRSQVKKGKEISAELQGFAFAKRIAERRKLNEAAGGEWAENLLAITASVIYDVITAPILARIRREEERAV